jgi:protein involved in polysaccharide export with SLBB domain/capsular polysaccharide biosynthesis protein
MNEQPDSNAGPLRPRDPVEFHATGNTIPGADHQTRTPSVKHSTAPDFWTILDLLARRWKWLAIGTILGCAAFLGLGWIVLVKPKFTATIQLLRYENPGTSESLKGTPLSTETFSGLIVSPDLLRRVGDQIRPPLPPEKLLKQMNVDPQPESDIVKVHFAFSNPTQAVDVANLYGAETVAFTRDLQARQAAEIANNYLKKQVAEMDADLAVLHQQFRGMPVSPQVTNKLAQVSSNLTALNENLTTRRPSPLAMKLSEKLQTSLAELSELTAKFTDAHPLVQQKRAQIESLNNQIASTFTNSDSASETKNYANVFNGGPQSFDPNLEIIQAKLRSLEDARIQMSTRQREAELYAENPPGNVRVFAPATLKTVETNHRRIKTGLLTIFGGCFGLGCSLGFLIFVEAFDNRLKTVDDVKRVTRLPVLTTLGDLDRMKEFAQTQWAFRTWTILQGRLSHSANHGLVCGITSSVEGEGRSTWIKLLAEAASMAGFRVLTIATQPSPVPEDQINQITEHTLDNPSEVDGFPDNNSETAVAANVLNTPSKVTEQLTDPNSQPIVHIPLPGWVWNLERRKQWRSALNQWRQIDNLVIFVELPPASVPEAVLLGSNLPNLIWLTESGIAEASETRTQLETLRHARCNLVGAVLNREQSKPVKRFFPRWVTCCILFALLGLFTSQAQTTNAPLPVEAPPGEAAEPGLAANPPATNLFFSAVNSPERAVWQKHLTLGAGDVLSFAFYGEPLLTRQEVAIAPDGRVSYLEAQDIMAAGLTVDELRTKMDEELGKYRRVARTVITPIAYHSKKYFVLGKVVQKGVYTLDRPTTVLEALARARGIEAGAVDNNTVDLADFSRSFLARGGKRISLDFEKLFANGDLSQNIQIEPNDYLYFPSAEIKQVYVLGEVSLPGPVTWQPDLTPIGAISSRGGFNVKAWKSRVLVVRGSLNNPETFAVDTLAILNGKAIDFRLQPKDIVYVTNRPWFRAEDLLDMATTAFIQSIISEWVDTIIAP